VHLEVEDHVFGAVAVVELLKAHCCLEEEVVVAEADRGVCHQLVLLAEVGEECADPLVLRDKKLRVRDAVAEGTLRSESKYHWDQLFVVLKYPVHVLFPLVGQQVEKALIHLFILFYESVGKIHSIT